MEVGSWRVCQESLGSLVSTLRHSRLGFGCIVSGSPLQWSHGRMNKTKTEYKPRETLDTLKLDPKKPWDYNPTWSTNGAQFWDGAFRPAAPTVTAALHFGHQLWVLVGTASVQHACIAVATSRIWGMIQSVKWEKKNLKELRRSTSTLWLTYRLDIVYKSGISHFEPMEQ